MVPMRRRRSVLPLAIVVILAAGCAGGPTPSPSPEPSPTPSPSVSPSVSPGPSPSPRPTHTPTPTPAPSPTPCPALPEGGAIASDHLVAIELDESADRDLVVFRFDGNTPGAAPTVRFESVEPPFVLDPSGLPLEVQGERFLRIRFDGMWLYDEAGVATRGTDVPIAGSPPAVVEVALESEFEGVSSWIVGMVGSGCLSWESRGDELVLALTAKP